MVLSRNTKPLTFVAPRARRVSPMGRVQSSDGRSHHRVHGNQAHSGRYCSRYSQTQKTFSVRSPSTSVRKARTDATRWVARLPGLFAAAGLQQSSMEEYTAPSHLLRSFGDVHLGAVEEMTHGDMDEQIALYFRDLLKESGKQYAEGAVICYRPSVCVGRKPS